MAKINCNVDSCTFYGKGDVCKADSIMVKNNKNAAYDMEIGSMGQSNPSSSPETMCETFKPKASQNNNS